MGHKRPTQAQRILDYIERFGGITQYEALQDLGVMRLASRISELRSNGHAITCEWIDVKNRFGETCKIKRYKLMADEQKEPPAHPQRRLERAIQSEINRKEA